MTDTDLANSALTHAGIPRINNIDDNTEEAEQCKANIDPARVTFLQEAAPGFSRREVALSLATGETSNIYTYVYYYPADCVKSRKIWNGSNNSKDIVYETGANSAKTSKLILTDHEGAILVYTADITNLNMYSEDDLDAIAIKLAAKIVPVLRRNERKQLTLEQKYEIAKAKAMKNNRKDQHKEVQLQDRYITARQ